MLIIKFCGGLGNQIYQLVMVKLLEELYPNVEIKVDLLAFKFNDVYNFGNGHLYSDSSFFAIDKLFDIELIEASLNEIKKCNYEILPGELVTNKFPILAKKIVGASRYANLRAKIFKNYKIKRNNYIINIPYNSFNDSIFSLDEKQNYYFAGLWQNFTYYELLNEKLNINSFKKPPESSRYKTIRDYLSLRSNSVGIHIRAGDFLSDRFNKTHNICGMNYYKAAIKLIEENVINPEFFIFTDDSDLISSKLGFLKKFEIVSLNGQSDPINDFITLLECKNKIISNSTFSYWAAIISNEKSTITIAPRYSSKTKNGYYELSAPQNWHLIKPF